MDLLISGEQMIMLNDIKADCRIWAKKLELVRGGGYDISQHYYFSYYNIMHTKFSLEMLSYTLTTS